MPQAMMFARLTKVDEAKRQVTGVAASETPDRAREIFDYEASKPNFQSWSGQMAKATEGKSVGNLRAMHGNVAAGKLTDLVMDDLSKSIEVTAEVVDDNEWDKVMKGVYTGFSIGGSYGRKWDDPVRKGFKRYEAKPSEISLVDLPCNYDATFTMVKADGMEEQVPFHHPDEAELLAKLSDTTLSATDKADYAQRLAKLYDPEGSNPVNQEDEELAKGAYTIERLACLAEQIESLLSYSKWTVNGETVDGAGASAIPAQLKTAANAMYDALLACVSADVAAAKDRLKGVKKAVDEDELQKATAAEELRKQADESATAEHDTLSKVFGISVFGIAEGAALDDAVESINKFVGAHDELQKKHDALQAEVEDLKKRAEPAKGAVKPVPVAKADDNAQALKKDAAAPDEEKDPVALMKAAQAKPIAIGTGGTLTKPA